MDLVVGDVDQPGAEETSPANCQHDMDLVRGERMVIAVDILDHHSFSQVQFSQDRQTEENINIRIRLHWTIIIILT